MGRFYYNTKPTAEQSTEISIFEFNRWGLLEGLHASTLTWTRRWSGSKSAAGLVVGAAGSEPYVRLRYTITRYRDGSKQDYDYKIGLTTTPCRLGGVRYWFVCPHCGRRSGKLYRRPVGEVYLCRICNDLTYESRNETRLGRWGQKGFFLVAYRRMEEMRKEIKRWTWAGRPTRKVRRLNALQERADSLSGQIPCPLWP
jgi:hypothetical protein